MACISSASLAARIEAIVTPDMSRGLTAEAEPAILAESLPRRRQQAKTGQEGAKSSQAIQQMVGQRGRGRRSHATDMARAARTDMAGGVNRAGANSMQAPGLGSGDPVPQELALPSLSSSPWLGARLGRALATQAREASRH